jgi:UPF0271 protein
MHNNYTNNFKHNLQIDVNCDMGEGMDNEMFIMPFISSANIACGFHAGNEYTIKKTIQLALENKVAIGAHPSYDDLANFGRISQTISLLELAELIAEQIYIFEKVAQPMGVKMHHIKLHGALYNDCAKDENMSKIFVQTIQAIDPDLIIYGLSGSNTIQQAIIHGQPYCNEVFADRTYQKNGQLTPRYLDNAMIESTDDMLQQVMSMIKEKKVKSLYGDIIAMQADTICIHGDGPNAYEFAQNLHEHLKNNQIEIKCP